MQNFAVEGDLSKFFIFVWATTCAPNAVVTPYVQPRGRLREYWLFGTKLELF